MKPLRYSIAILIMRGAGLVADLVAPEIKKDAPARLPMRPIEQMLLGSIVSLSICALWVWFSMRSGL
ncbi:hypothetical protein ASD50_07550 [Mesorhizobium sp. Root552]|jgi:hypothetical protein|uniref:hypothetical protein n=1 Tax=Mesorhizobium sp. Root552 TaxID=1736555 RepID=UPI0006F272F8|nr:hypothetical protein [Mesorhizobium sp. Root552]KQZ19332.1 hypothetical protein ASD50_07550 [Mesorhizobium sp. Root552]